MNRKRRGRGEGGIRYRNDKKLWVAEVRAGTAQNRRSRTVYGKTKKEVQDKLRKIQQDMASGISADAATLTMSQFFDRWLAQVKPTVEPNTHSYYERLDRKHIRPHVGT